MMFDYLMVFTVVVFFVFILVVIFLFGDESRTVNKEVLDSKGFSRHVGNWRAAVPLIVFNLLFIIYVIYGFYNIEFFYVGTSGFTAGIYGTEAHSYDAYIYGFWVFWFMHVLLLFICGFYSWYDALSTRGKIEYKMPR